MDWRAGERQCHRKSCVIRFQRNPQRKYFHIYKCVSSCWNRKLNYITVVTTVIPTTPFNTYWQQRTYTQLCVAILIRTLHWLHSHVSNSRPAGQIWKKNLEFILSSPQGCAKTFICLKYNSVLFQKHTWTSFPMICNDFVSCQNVNQSHSLPCFYNCMMGLEQNCRVEK